MYVCMYAILLPRNSLPVIDAMGSCGSLSCDVMRWYNPLRRRELFETFPKLKLGLHFGQNMSTLNELIGYADLTDCRKIWQKQFGRK